MQHLSEQQEILHILTIAVRGIILACIRNLNRCEILIFSIAFRYITFQKRSKFYCYFIGKLKSATRNETKVTLRLSFNFTHKLSQTNRHVCSRCKALMNHSSAQIELSRTKMYKILQSGWFLRKLLGPLMKVGLPIMKNVLTLLPISVLPGVNTTGKSAAAAADTGTLYKNYQLGNISINHFKWGNDWYYENRYISWKLWLTDKRCYLDNWKWNEKTKRRILWYCML